MKLAWLEDGGKKGNCYAGITFRDVRMLTFRVCQKHTSYFDKTTGKPAWVATVGDEPLGTFPNKGQAQQMCQKFLTDFIRGLFAFGDN